MISINNSKKTTIQLLVILIVLVFYDTSIDFLLGTIHAVFELFHTLFEFIEQTLDLIIEHVFHTEPHTTQVIVFYILLSGGSFIVFKAAKVFLVWYKRWLKEVMVSCNKTKEQIVFYSKNLFFLKKIQRFSVVMMVLSVIIAFGF